MDFQWKPGHGPDHEALERMKQHFKKPMQDPCQIRNTPEPHYYPGLLEALTTNLDLSYIERFLCDVGSGLWIFGRREDGSNGFCFYSPTSWDMLVIMIFCAISSIISSTSIQQRLQRNILVFETMS